MNSSKKTVIRVLKILCVFLAILIVESGLSFFIEKPTTSHWKAHELRQNKDVITNVFIGPSRTLNSINPETTDKYLQGYSYNLGTATQKFSQSYYIVKDCIKTYKNFDILCLEVNGLDNPIEFIDIMSRKSAMDLILNPFVKLEFMHNNFLIDELPYLFLSLSSIINIYDFSLMKKSVSIKLSDEYHNYEPTELFSDCYYVGRGFSPCQRVIDDEKYEAIKAIEDFELNDDSLLYLYKIIDICNKNNITIVFYSTPRPDRFIERNIDLYDYCYNKYEEISSENGISFYDFNLYKNKSDLFEDRIDYVDTAHLNDVGSEKFSEILGKTISLDLQGQDCSNDFHNTVYDLKF